MPVSRSAVRIRPPIRRKYLPFILTALNLLESRSYAIRLRLIDLRKKWSGTLAFLERARPISKTPAELVWLQKFRLVNQADRGFTYKLFCMEPATPLHGRYIAVFVRVFDVVAPGVTGVKLLS